MPGIGRRGAVRTQQLVARTEGRIRRDCLQVIDRQGRRCATHGGAQLNTDSTRAPHRHRQRVFRLGSCTSLCTAVEQATEGAIDFQREIIL